MKRVYRWLFGVAPYSIELFIDSADFWRWRIRAENRQILASSEAYSSREAALKTANALSNWTGIHVEVEKVAP